MIAILIVSGVVYSQTVTDANSDTGKPDISQVEQKVENITKKLEDQIRRMDRQLDEADELIRHLKADLAKSEKLDETQLRCLSIVDEYERQSCEQKVYNNESASAVIDDMA